MMLYPSARALKDAVADAKQQARREARRSCRGGFLQSRGNEVVYADARGDKLNDGGTDYWDGNQHGLNEAVAAGLRRYGDKLAAISFEGGFNHATSLRGMRDGDYDPLVSEWALMVWRSPTYNPGEPHV
jgi:hypothetical protein